MLSISDNYYNLFLQEESEKAVINSSGSLFEEIKVDEKSVIFILSGAEKALHVNDAFCCTRIMAVPTNISSNKQKWILTKHKDMQFLK